MPDPTLGTMTPTDPAKTLAKAAEVLGIPAGSVVRNGFIELPPGASPTDVVHVMRPRVARECHMRSLSACQNEPHCSEWGECVLYLAIGLRVGPFMLRRIDNDTIQIMNGGEGGDFSAAELSEVIGRFVSERL